jgi:isoamylase
MITAGDEWGRSQHGNNNAYCQDSPLSWLDWDSARAGEAMTACVSRLLALRWRLHAYAEKHFAHGMREPREGLPDIAWFGADGSPLTPEQWSDPEGRSLALRRVSARTPNGGGHAEVQTTLLLLNATGDDMTFTLPPPEGPWLRLFDSSEPGNAEQRTEGDAVPVPAHALVLMLALDPWSVDEAPVGEVR